MPSVLARIPSEGWEKCSIQPYSFQNVKSHSNPQIFVCIANYSSWKVDIQKLAVSFLLVGEECLH